MAAAERVICAAADLIEAGDGVRFETQWEGRPASAFAIRHGGRVYAFLNRCAHVAVELDWQLGKFFDAEGEHLICSTHGATYEPHSGLCVRGPCKGAALISIPVEEINGKVVQTSHD
jgi:nitrite reductase/ring-hydroxylating ferredoxin subunit